MDVSKVQKINSLALDLMKQGLAKDREDAVIQAERAFASHKDDYASIRERMESIPMPGTPVKQAESVALTQDQVKEILEQNAAFMVHKIKEFQDKLTAIEEEVVKLRTRSTIVSTTRPTAPAADEKTSATASGSSSSSSANHPRSGQYKQEDVSIEKVFYMGKK